MCSLKVSLNLNLRLSLSLSPTVVSHRLAGHAQRWTTAVDWPGALRLEEPPSGGSSRSPALVRASAAPAGPHPTTRIARPFLRLSAVSLDAHSLMGIQADLPPACLHRQNAQGWGVHQDYPESLRHAWYLMATEYLACSVYEEGCGMVAGHREAAGRRTPLPLSSCPHLQVRERVVSPKI